MNRCMSIARLVLVSLLGLSGLVACGPEVDPDTGNSRSGRAEAAFAAPRPGEVVGPAVKGSHSAQPAPAGWINLVQQRISDGEYRFRRKGEDFRAANRAQGLVALFDAGGVTVTDRQGKGRIGLRLAASGRAGYRQGACDSTGRLDERGECLARLEARHRGVTEWWENRAEGLEQGLVVESGGDRLSIEFVVEGAAVKTTAGQIEIIPPAGGRYRYGSLLARDAAGRRLSARFAGRGESRFAIEVVTSGASWPVEIDPLLTSAAWTAESDQANAQFGYVVSTAGDVNGDGYDDVIVGAPYYYDNMGSEGWAFLYLGSASGLSTTPAWTAESNQPDAWFGNSVFSAGDVNGDGYADVIVGAPYYDNGETNEGRAYLYLGSASGLSSTPDWTAEPNQAYAQFGFSVSTAGDVNGDGYADVIIGAYGYDNGETNEGRAYLYLGSASGLSATPAWTAESNQPDARFGYSVSAAGDVNANGYADVIVGAYLYGNGETNEGQAYLYLGSASGLSAAPDWTAESDQANAYFGISVSSAGDVNGDGYADVIIGACAYDSGQADEGRAFLYLGSATGLSATPSWTAESDQVGAYFGRSVSSAGDVNGDGYADVVVGAQYYDNGATDEGRIFIYSGNGGDGAISNLALRPQAMGSAGPIAPWGKSDMVGGFRTRVWARRSPFGRQKVKLEVEAKPLGSPFDGTATSLSSSWIDTQTTGAQLEQTLSGLDPGAYHWRARLVYAPFQAPEQAHSPWLWGGISGQPSQVHVRVVNFPPQITTTAPLTATEDIAYTYDADATDPDRGRRPHLERLGHRHLRRDD